MIWNDYYDCCDIMKYLKKIMPFSGFSGRYTHVKKDA